MNGISVYESRLRMGNLLAETIKKQISLGDIDVVMPIPDSSRPAAMQVARQLGIEYREGFFKNRYVGRTFIMPGQSLRKRSVRQKLNAMSTEFKNKNVLIVDDSVVRGTTSQQIVQMARSAGANKVTFTSAAPPIRYPHVYGINMPSRNELIAYNRNINEIEELVKRTSDGGAEIVALLKTGSAYFAPSSAAATMVKSIISDSNEIMPACSWVNGEFGINDVFLRTALSW